MKKIYLVYTIYSIFVFILIIGTSFIREFHIGKKFKLSLVDYKKVDFYAKEMAKSSQSAVRIAQQSLQGKYEFQIKSSNFSPIEKDLNSIWKTSKNFDSNSHELYAHSLIILWDLLVVHQQNYNNEYLHKGHDIIITWINNNKRFNPLLTRYAWEDHSTAKRTIAILIFLDYYNQYIKVDDDFREKVELYCANALFFLKNPQNYSFKHNHGIFQDIALLLLCIHNSNPNIRQKYCELAAKRFERQVLFCFSPNGVHLGNSPGYHFLVTQKCKDFVRFSGGIISLDSDVKDRIKKADLNKKFFVMPNHKLAPIGDTNSSKNIGNVYSESPFFMYDSLAGYEIYQDIKNNYLFFRTQSILPNHLHNDVLSFLYYNKDGEIISETGFLNYTNSKERLYTKSFQAHNTIMPISSLDKGNFQIKGIIKNYAKDNSNFFTELEGIFSNGNVCRQFFMDSNQNYLIIRDSISSTSSEEWIRFFYTTDELNHIELINDFLIKVILKNGEIYYISSYKNPIMIEKGKVNPWIGWKAIPLRHLIPSYTITQKSNSNIFLLLAISKSIPVKFISQAKCKIAFYKGFKRNKITIYDDIVTINNAKLGLKKIQDSIIPNMQPRKKRRISYFHRNLLFFLNIFGLMFSLIVLTLFNKISENQRLVCIFASFPLLISMISIVLLFVMFVN
ncbi:MAG: heparinase II/III family protein [Candidatus Cloacimonadota bacterium]|nr:heparinase II/III family protein [Candidatus Cloacimonadota bacterium]